MEGGWQQAGSSHFNEQGKKVCKVTAVQCYQCFSLRLLLFLACRANWLKKLEELYGSVVNSGGTAVTTQKVGIFYVMCELVMLGFKGKEYSNNAQKPLNCE